MIEYIPHNNIDTDKWDDSVAQALNKSIYAYSWYLDLVCDKWDALVQDDYKTIMPLPANTKMGISYLFQPDFTQQLGIISKTTISSNTMNNFLAAIPKKFKIVEINLNKSNIPNKNNPAFISNANYELDLNKSYIEIYPSYSSNLKRNLKKAEKNNITTIQNIKPDEIINLFKENRGKKIKTLTDKSYQRLSRLIYVLIHRGQAQIWGSYNDTNELIAGAFFIKNGDNWVFLFSGTSEKARKNSAMPFLIDTFIKNNANSKAILDFEGSNDKNLARFYKSFGAKRTTYYGYRQNNLPFPVKETINIIKKIKSIIK